MKWAGKPVLCNKILSQTTALKIQVQSVLSTPLEQPTKISTLTVLRVEIQC
jgi:hypothetical protein